jgi:hypothetical protein
VSGVRGSFETLPLIKGNFIRAKINFSKIFKKMEIL